MNRDDIIRMAREAGFPEHRAFSDLSDLYPRLERFATLVAAAEIDRIIAENAPVIEEINSYIKTLEDAVAANRARSQE